MTHFSVSLVDIKINFTETSFEREAVFGGLFGTWIIPGNKSDHACKSLRDGEQK